MEEDTSSMYGASVYVTQCEFRKNADNMNIWLLHHVNSYLEVNESVFVENLLIEDEYYPHAGLISSSDGGTVRVLGSEESL